MTDVPLFGGFEPAPVEPLSAGRRLSARIQQMVSNGVHPLMKGPLHPEASRQRSPASPGTDPFTCGTCTHRDVGGYPKCDVGPLSRAVTTDVRAWWPACPSYDPKEAR